MNEPWDKRSGTIYQAMCPRCFARVLYSQTTAKNTVKLKYENGDGIYHYYVACPNCKVNVIIGSTYEYDTHDCMC